MDGEAVAAVRAEGLSKRFGSALAVEDVSLEIAPGEIFGFLGPNGAGKTTTIRMLLGLIAPTSGRATLFGHDVARDFKRAIAHVGALVEGPAFYPFLTGRQNLRLFARVGARADRERIDEVLDQVGMTNPADKRVAGYSQGMRQRLGIALALLERPPLLVLDEPTNGLDPQGTREIRELMRRVRDDDGTAILVSSHLLAEMELVCDRVAVIAKGSILESGRLDDVVGGGDARVELGVGSGQGARALEELRAVGVLATAPRQDALEFLRRDAPDGDLSALNRALVDAGIAVHRIAERRRTLEEAFVDLTGERPDIR